MNISTLVFLLTLSQAPIIVCFSYFYIKDRYQPEPLNLLFTSFMLGVAAFPLAVSIEYLGGSAQIFSGTNSYLQIAFFAFITVALVEESCKFLVVRLVPFRSPHFDEPFDGIMYSVAVALGFAGIENLGYTYQYGVTTAIFRMFTAVPMHTMCAVIMGFYLGLARFSPRHRRGLQISALTAATLLHGVYDYFFALNTVLTVTLGFVLLCFQLLLAVRAIRIHQTHATAALDEISKNTSDEILVTTVSWATIPLKALAAVCLLCSIFAIFFPDIRQALIPPGKQTAALGMIFLLLLGAALLRLASSLASGNRWAWNLAFVVFFLLLPTMLFPLSMAGLFGLCYPAARTRMLAL